MAQIRLILTQAEAQALASAHAVLQAGDPIRAAAAVREVLRDVPESPDALHLLALCKRHSGDASGAAQAFEHALRHAPRHIDMLNNYGALLLQMGRAQEAAARHEAALRLDPSPAETWIRLSHARLALTDARGALEAARGACARAPRAPRALYALAAALRETGDLDGAEDALRRALAIDPDSGWGWVALGVVRRLIGDPEDSLACYAKARALGYNAAELADAEASAHLDLGDFKMALAAASALTQTAPDYVAGHVLVAHIQWEYGVGDSNDPLGAFERAVAAQPRNHDLRTALINMLLKAKRPQETIPHLRVLRAAQDNATLVSAHAAALDQMGDLAGASAVFAQALPLVDASQGMGVAYAQHLIRVGRADEAVRYALLDCERDPQDQQAWATLSIAWRLTNDPREHWLCDYERFVMAGQIEPPEGYADLPAFMAALSEALTAMHVAQREPINQSLRGGTQTGGELFGRRIPVIASARDALRNATRKAIASLPQNDTHPFLRRRTGDVRFTGSWSVRLRASGRHINHFHPKGWISSAFYVQLPPALSRGGAGHEGWIQFGQPPEESGLALAPRRFVEPKEAMLVLFPSYMLHGTVPFSGDAPRLTVAFDATPK